MSKEKNSCLLAVRVRSSAGLTHRIEAILRNLGLNRRNQAMLIVDTPAIRGTLKVVKDTLFWGEATEDILSLLLSKRTKIVKVGSLTDQEVKKRFSITNIKALAKSLSTGEIKPQDLKRHGVNIRYSLNSPKGGYGGKIKEPFGKSGILGYRGDSIGELVKKMI
ncbi:uL30 family ribosomal protein [[Eubacterium] cellulosolvens]